MERHVRWRARQLRLQLSAKLGHEVQQQEVANATGMSISTLSNIENNRVTRVDFATLERLAAFYGVGSICELLELSEEKPVEKPAPGPVGLVRANAY